MNDVADVNGMSKISAGVGTLLAAAVPVEQEGGDERAEEQAVRREEQPHRELGVGEPGVRVVRVVGGVTAVALEVAAGRRRNDLARPRRARLLDGGHQAACSGSVGGSIPHTYTPKRRSNAPGMANQGFVNTAA